MASAERRNALQLHGNTRNLDFFTARNLPDKPTTLSNRCVRWQVWRGSCLMTALGCGVPRKMVNETGGGETRMKRVRVGSLRVVVTAVATVLLALTSQPA